VTAVLDVQPRAEIQPDAVYTRAEAAELLRVTLKVLDRVPIKRLKLGRRTVRYRGRDILEYLERSAQ